MIKIIEKCGYDYDAHMFIPSIGKCECGEEIELRHFTNTCNCGRDYNSAGSLLASREQWGEETGETAADILNMDYHEDDPCLQDEWYESPHTHGVSVEDC